MNKRLALRDKLIRNRKVMSKGCEGQPFLKHECAGRWDLHEAIFSKMNFKHLKGKAREYFELDERNLAILCRIFHTEHGASTAFGDYWREYAEKYGSVEDYIENAPLKVKA